MAERGFEQSIVIAAAPGVVHAFLSDLHRHRDLHPLIERIEDLPPHPGRPDVRRYRVTDRMHLGPLSFRIHYVAEIRPVPPDLILGTAWQSPGVEVRTQYRVAAGPGGGTLVREDVRLKAPFVLINALRRAGARAARAARLPRLARHCRPARAA
jgi:hypothetical protein